MNLLLLVIDGEIFTSAGLLFGIDLMCSVLETIGLGVCFAAPDDFLLNLSQCYIIFKVDRS